MTNVSTMTGPATVALRGIVAPGRRAGSSHELMVLVRGAGNVGSAVARALCQAALPVVLLQDREAATLRRQMAYEPALFEGDFALDGVQARRVSLEQAHALAGDRHSIIPLITGSLVEAIAQLAPTIIVDACIKGAVDPADLRGLAPLTIGIGPRFCAGQSVDLVIESAWGPRLGAVITQGGAARHPCKPEVINGLSWERFARAPKSGLFRTDRKIGERVRKHSVVGTIDDLAVTAPISGTIRGLLRDGLAVGRGGKFMEIDPRLSAAQFTGVAERPARIAAGVLGAIRTTLLTPAPPLQ